MLTEIKLVQNTHYSLECWYRTSLVFTRKTNANRNQTGTKIIYTAPYNAGIETVWYSEEKQMLTKIKLYKIHTAPYNASIQPVWYSEEKQMLTEIKLVQNTHCSLQC